LQFEQRYQLAHSSRCSLVSIAMVTGLTKQAVATSSRGWGGHNLHSHVSSQLRGVQARNVSDRGGSR
jgi:hypothetical protein